MVLLVSNPLRDNKKYADELNRQFIPHPTGAEQGSQTAPTYKK